MYYSGDVVFFLGTKTLDAKIFFNPKPNANPQDENETKLTARCVLKKSLLHQIEMYFSWKLRQGRRGVEQWESLFMTWSEKTALIISSSSFIVEWELWVAGRGRNNKRCLVPFFHLTLLSSTLAAPRERQQSSYSRYVTVFLFLRKQL